MSSSVVKWGGLAGLATAILLILSAILNQVAPVEGVVDTTNEYIYRAIVVLAYIGIIVAVLGIHALHRGNARYGLVGTWGSVITIVGYAIIALVTVIATVQEFEYLLTVRFGGGVLVLIGSLLLGAMIIRARLLPWWCGVLLIIAFPLGDVANAIFSSAENLLLALLWGSMGFALLSRGRAAAQSPTRQAVSGR
ncbi:MAG TPA: hypothetical protein VE462_02270 [Propionibacteriaceae bacterium]|jgi:hypothetical protein|nr:hypothetical protein [Propionibacteriaceae bacterium]